MNTTPSELKELVMEALAGRDDDPAIDNVDTINLLESAVEETFLYLEGEPWRRRRTKRSWKKGEKS